LFYMVAYTFMNLGAFGVLILLARRGNELNTIEDLQGLAASQPGAAAMMALFMLSLGGIPPTAGFMGKLFLFLAAVHAHQYALAVIGLLASIIGVSYYLIIIRSMYFQPAKREFPRGSLFGYAPGADVALIVSAIITLALGMFSGRMYGVARIGAESLDRGAITAPLAAQPASPEPRVSLR